jgi:hypothetical protein
MVFLLSDGIKDSWRQLRKFWPVVIPALAVFAMYALVVWLTRYTTGVMLAVFAAMIGSLTIAAEEKRVRVLRASSIALGSVVVVLVMQSMFQNYHDRSIWVKEVELAEQLHSMGIERGDHLAVVGDGFDEEIWGRLDGIEIVAEVPHTLATGDSVTAFWSSSSEIEQKVLDALKTSGARAVVATTPTGGLPTGWIPIGNTGHAVFFFR